MSDLGTGMSLKRSVLVVDDDLFVLKVARSRLERAGWEVTTRSEALGTAQWIAKYKPTAVLLDVSMPALSGDNLGAVLKRNGLTEEIALILHSGMDVESLSSLVQTTGATGIIQKTGNDAVFMTKFNALVEDFHDARPKK